MDQATTLRRMVNIQNERENMKRSGDINIMPRVISFSSGKGGVGKSQIVANMALVFSRLGYRVLILDADLGLANIDIMYGVHPKYTIYDVLKNNVSMKDTVINVHSNVDLIPAASGIMEMTSLSKMQKLSLLNQIDTLEEEYDILLIDTASGISKDVLSFNVAAEEIVLVTTPEPTAITDAYALLKILATRYKEKDFKLLVNLASKEREALKVYEKLSNVADQHLSVKIEYLGYLPKDKSVGNSVMVRQPVLKKNPVCPASVHFNNLANQLIKMPLPKSSKGTVQFFWKKLLTARSVEFATQ